MCKQYLFLVCAILVLHFGDCAPPQSLTKCKSDDSKCIKETTKSFMPLFVAGLPEYDIESLDPLLIRNINASNGNLLFTLSDVTVKGLKNCDVKKISRDKENSKIILKVQCTATLDGNYFLKGSVLIVPLGGEGKIHVGLNSAVINVVIYTVEKTNNDGIKHWHIKTYQPTFDLKEKSNVIFENLNKDNEVLGSAARDLLATNSNDVIKEIGFPVINAIINRVVKNVNHLFKAMAIEDLSID